MSEPSREVDQPEVVVILLNWRGWKDTIECLESVYRQSYPKLRVVVCDNDSGDESIARIRAWAAGEQEADTSHAAAFGEGNAVVRKPIAVAEYDRAAAERGGNGEAIDAPLVIIQTGGNLGFAGGNNVGIRYALARPGTRYVWLLNNDTVADREALARMVGLAESEPRAGMIGSKVMNYDDPGVIQAAAGGSLERWRGLTRHVAEGERDAGQWDHVFEPDYITGASLLVKAEAIRSIGEMEESYFLYSEEVDWCLRARQAGWRLLYSPGSLVWHKGGQSVGYSSPVHDYYSLRSMLMLIRRFYPGMLPAVLAYSVYRSLLPKVVRLEPARFRAVLHAYRDFFRGEAGARGR